MRPLIKWAGGKSSEIKYVENIMPEFNRYVEPFFGGGAVFFDLEPKRAVINDISGELMTFYKLLKNGKSGEDFKEELYRYVEAWDKINVYMKKFGESFLNIYLKYREDKLTYEQVSEKFDKLFEEKIIPFNGLFKPNFCVEREGLLREIKKNLLSKLKRTKEKIDTKKKFNAIEIKKNIETGFRAGLYMHFRNIMNQSITNKIKISKEKKIANWYFIREFCYGGMFRFNRSGEFNVPYGGIAYNKKDFKTKVDYIFSDKVRNLLTNTKTENKDFEELLTSLDLKEDDFIFLDPPYDTEFSKYEDNPFTKEDQKRLANALIKTKAKWILIIKETDFIRELYEDKKGIKLGRFGKSYMFNIKERVNTAVQHLIIHNLDIPEENQIKLFTLL
jgi:DNA adenine methylase